MVDPSLLLLSWLHEDGAHPAVFALSREMWLALALASLLSGLVGTIVVLRRLVSLGGGIAHAAFGGVGLALVAGFDPRLGAALVAVGAAVLLAPLGKERLARQDAVIGVLWSVGMAVGILLLSHSHDAEAELGGSAEHAVEELLFGDLGSVRSSDLLLLGGLVFAVGLILALFRRELVATAFDEEHARLRGLSAGTFSFVLLLLVALSVVALLSLVGIVLAIALLAIPPLIAIRLFRALPAIVLGATAIAFATSIAGLLLASRYDLPAGPAIILSGGAALALAHLVPRRASR